MYIVQINAKLTGIKQITNAPAIQQIVQISFAQIARNEFYNMAAMKCTEVKCNDVELPQMWAQ